MKTIAVCQHKGGTGKTTTALTLGAALSMFHRKRVLFVDMDIQRNLTNTLGADQSGLTVFDCLTRKATAKDAIKPLSDLNGAYILTGSKALAGADSTIAETGKEYRLKEALESVAGDFDFCIVDTPPALGILTINALTAADSTIITCLADSYSIQATNDILETIRAVQQYTNKALKIEGFLVTRYTARQVLSRDIADNLAKGAEGNGTRLFNARIRETVAIREAATVKQIIFKYSPKCSAAQDYKQLAKEII